MRQRRVPVALLGFCALVAGWLVACGENGSAQLQASARPALPDQAEELELAHFERRFDECVSDVAERASATDEELAWGVACATARDPEDYAAAASWISQISNPCWREFADIVAASNAPIVYGPTRRISTDCTRQNAMQDAEPAFVWAYARWLTEAEPGAARDFVALQREKLSGPWRARLDLLSASSWVGPDARDEALNRALRIADEILANDPRNVDALYQRAGWLSRVGRGNEADRDIRTAIAAVPTSVNVRQRHWSFVAASQPRERAAQELLEEIETFRKQFGNVASAEWTAVYRLGEVGLSSESDFAKNLIVETWPTSVEAEWIKARELQYFTAKARALAADSAERRSIEEKLLAEVESLIRRKPPVPSMLADAMRSRIVVLATSRHNVDKMPVALSDFLTLEFHQPGHYEMALRAGIDAGLGSDDLLPVLHAGRAAVARWSTPQDAASDHARLSGWEARIRVAEGQYAHAEEALLAAAVVLGDDDPEVRAVEAYVAAAQKQTARAELALRRCLHYPVCRRSVEPTYRALSITEPFDAWRKRLATEGEKERKRQVLGSRINPPRVINLDDPGFGNVPGQPTFAELTADADVVIIKFTSITCGHCIDEIPDLNKYVDALATDARLLVVLVDDDLGDATKVLAEHGYKGPVLDGRKFQRAYGISAFPTAWFLDARGNLFYERTGRTERLAEEYAWRADDIRERSVK